MGGVGYASVQGQCLIECSTTRQALQEETNNLKQPCKHIDCCIKTSWETKTQKHNIYTHRKERKQPKHNTKEGHQITRGKTKQKKDPQKQIQIN